MDKCSLTYNDFDTNIREYFRSLREEQRLFDVTLATDDGQQMQAHKIILSAASSFFSNIFLKTDSVKMLVYLKGISSSQLEHIINFMYKGEVFIAEEDLKEFIETGEELQVKGLQSEFPDMKDDRQDHQNKDIGSEFVKTENKPECIDNAGNKEIFRMEDITDNWIFSEAKSNEGGIANDELDIQIEGLIEKTEGIWKCKMCEKTTKQKGEIRDHAEIHIDGNSQSCHICSKKFPTRHNLQMHIYSIHSELVSCDLCGKSGMTKGASYKHKERNHKAISK